MEAAEEATEGAYLGENHLRQITGEEDLTQVCQLELVADTTEASLSAIGENLSNLKRMKLSGSSIESVRHLGTALRNLQVLWLARCGLRDLEGIAGLPQLRELYASFNDISDLAPLSDSKHLQVLDMEANRVDDIDAIGLFLSDCKQLVTLTLEGNLVTAQPHYRGRVCQMLNQLELLDERPVSDSDRLAVPSTMDEQAGSSQSTVEQANPSAGPDRELALVEDGIKYAKPDVATIADDWWSRIQSSLPSTSARPQSARPRGRSAESSSRPSIRPSTASARRPRSSCDGFPQRPSTALCSRPATPGLFSFTINTRMPASKTFGFTDEDRDDDCASDLTFGSDAVFCGNPAKGLRNRHTRDNANNGCDDANADNFVLKAQTVLDAEQAHAQMLEHLRLYKMESALANTAMDDETSDAPPWAESHVERVDIWRSDECQATTSTQPGMLVASVEADKQLVDSYPERNNQASSTKPHQHSAQKPPQGRLRAKVSQAAAVARSLDEMDLSASGCERQSIKTTPPPTAESKRLQLKHSFEQMQTIYSQSQVPRRTLAPPSTA
eukprot:jgi/Chlat1/6470/Chrsp45S05969